MIGAATMEDVDACVLEDPWLIDLLRGRLINEENGRIPEYCDSVGVDARDEITSSPGSCEVVNSGEIYSCSAIGDSNLTGGRNLSSKPVL